MASYLPEGSELEAQEKRRVPVYLLLDISGSMEGAPLMSLQNALEHFQTDLKNDQFTRDSVWFGIITFADDAQWVTDGLQPIESFQMPDLTAGGVTRLDKAFEVLRESLDKDIRKPILGKQQGDGRPIVFVFTDGKPTDEKGEPDPKEPDVVQDLDKLKAVRWKVARDMVVSDKVGGTASRGSVRLYDIYPFGCGPSVDDEVLKVISTGLAFHVDKDAEGFAQFCKLMTMISILSAQKQATAGEPGPIVEPEDLPPDIGAVVLT